MTKCRVTCTISLFFLEKKSEIWNAFTFFEKWKVKQIFLSLFLRNEKWNDLLFHSFREVRVKLKYFETEIERWNFKKKPREFSRNETLAGYCIHPLVATWCYIHLRWCFFYTRYNTNSTYATQRNTRPRVLNIDWPTALSDVSTGFHWINFDTKKPFNIHTTQHPPTYGTTMLHPSEMVFFSLSPSPSCSKSL